MENKLKNAFDRVTMPDQCAKKIEKKLCKPEEKKGYYAEPIQPTKNGWVKGIAAAAVLVLLCCIVLPGGAQFAQGSGDQKWLEICEAALAELQSRDSVHLTASIVVNGHPDESGAENHYWQQGDTWLRIGEMNFVKTYRDYVVGNLWTGGREYRFGYAGNYDVVVKPTWTIAEEDQRWEKYWLMEFDLTAAEILSVEGESTGEGSVITIVYDGNPRVDSGTVYDTCSQVWYLDAAGKLVRLTEEETYVSVEDDTEYQLHAVAETNIHSTGEQEIADFLNEKREEISKYVETEKMQEELEGGKEDLGALQAAMQGDLEPGYAATVEQIKNGLSYPVGSILYTYSGWGNELNSSRLYDTTMHTPWTQIEEGRVIFTLDKTIDITDLFSEEEPFTYIYTDIFYITHYIAIGGTVEHPGYVELTKLCWETDMEEGNLGGFGVNTWNNETESRYEWVERAKEIFEPYGVYWVS